MFKGVDVEEEDLKAKKGGANSQPSPAMKKIREADAGTQIQDKSPHGQKPIYPATPSGATANLTRSFC